VVDTLIIIQNQNLFRVANEKTTFADAFAIADQVLYSGVGCITDLMVKEGLINLDFADVRAVMREMGKAMMGTGEATGEERALHAAEAAIANPLIHSAVPRAGPDHAPYTKRAMAQAMIDLMEALGFARFALAGHGRGGRVGYRLALDHPGRLARLAVIDIVPTYAMWHGMDRMLAYKVWHWTFLALPAPFPETLIGKDPVYYLDWKIASWTKAKDLSAFDPRALSHYRAFFQDPSRIHATCEDYRAGRTTDLALDECDHAAGRMIDCPVLALWGSAGIPRESGPLAIWLEWAKDVRGMAMDSGHFPCEENPEPTAKALVEFFAAPS
jgi:haloacetate dehalogenase